MRKVYFVALYTELHYKNWLGRPRYKTQLASVSVVVDGATAYTAHCSEFNSRYTDQVKHKEIQDDLLTQPHEERKPMQQIANEMIEFLFDQQLFGSETIVVTPGDPMQGWYFKNLWAMAQRNHWDNNEHAIHSILQYRDMLADMIPDTAFGSSSDFCTLLLPPYSLNAKRIMLLSHVSIPENPVHMTAHAIALHLRSMDDALTNIRNEFTKQIAPDEDDNSEQPEEAESNTAA